MMRVTLFILLFPSFPILADSARILGVFPIPSISHQVVYRALMMELAKRGHELVILTPNPVLPKERPPDNITEIDTGQSYQFLGENLKYATKSKALKRGMVMDVYTWIKIDHDFLPNMINHFFNLPHVKKFFEDKTQKFDLVFVEAISNYGLIAASIFKAPAILFSSSYGCTEHREAIGALTIHPTLYPHYMRNKFKSVTIWEKIEQVYLEAKIYQKKLNMKHLENEMLKRNFGPNAPTVDEIRNNVQMLFLNSHPIIDNNRPVPPSVIYLGGLHLQPVQPLPKDLKIYLDRSKRGVVYVSFGTNVRTSLMDEDFLNEFIIAFETLPYDILWKLDGDNLKKIPKNVHVEKWFPQRDLLMHPNVKAFVTQGGLQSTDEAIDAGVPLVGVPMLTDQWYNVNKYVELGIGVQVDVLTMSADDLSSAIRRVIEDRSFRQNMQKLRSVMKDQPQTALERAVWWTEHVLRHGGAHLRTPAANVSWSEYLMLDVLFTIAGIATVALILMLFLCCAIVSSYKHVTIKAKQS